jgi:hypothetical protein
MEEATISGLVFGFRSSREIGRVDLLVCLSPASYAAAEKVVRRMAIKSKRSKSIPNNLFKSF